MSRAAIIAPHVERLLARLPGAKPRGSGFRALCPGHDDHDPSLDVDLGDDGRILLICRSHNCSAESIVNEIGLSMSDLFPDSNHRSNEVPPPRRNGDGPKPTFESVESFAKSLSNVKRRFDYFDATGEHVYSVFRVEPPGRRKLFLPAHRQGTRWGGTHMPAPRALYRLPELLAAKPDDVVLVLEGEKCVEAAVAFGYVATTSAAGAKAADRTDWSPMRGRTVIVMPDADEDGASYADGVVALARAAGVAHVRVLRLPGLKTNSGEDLVDWVAAKGRAGMSRNEVGEELAMLIEATTGDDATEGAAEQPHDEQQAAPNMFAGYKLLDVDEVAKLPPIEWLIEDVLPERAIAVLAGDTMVGKSFLAIDLALRVQHGMPFFEHTVEPGSVIYFAGEGQSGLAARTNLWRQQHQGDPGGRFCLISEEIPVLSADTMPKLRAVIEAVVKAKGHAPKLIVIDTLSQGLDDDENDSKVIAPVMRGLAALRNEFGCTILILHHLVKQGTRAPKVDGEPTLDMVRGSGAVTRNIDTVLVAWKNSAGSRFWKVPKQKDGQELGPFEFRLHAESTGRRRRHGQVETSCIVVPGRNEAKAAPVNEEQAAQQERDQDMARLVSVMQKHAIEWKQSGEGKPLGKGGLAKLLKPMRKQDAFATIDLALSIGTIVNVGTDTRPLLLLPSDAERFRRTVPGANRSGSAAG